MGGIAGNTAPNGAKAWVNFDGTGTIGTNMAIRASFNVSSVFKNTTGDFTINFSNPLPDGNYAVVVSCTGDITGTSAYFGPDIRPVSTALITGAGSLTASSARIRTRATNTSDTDVVTATIFR